MSSEGSRINVSLDVLRNELTQLELRLVDRISAALETKADKAVVAEMDKRIVGLELSRASREHMEKDFSEMAAQIGQAATVDRVRELEDDVTDLRLWHNRTIGAVTLIAFVMPVLATISWHLWG